MKSFILTLRFVFLFMLLLISHLNTTIGQTVTLYTEDFGTATTGKGITGTTLDMTGITNWSIAYTGSWTPMAATEYFKVVGGAFESYNTDAPGVPTTANMTTACVWASTVVDISCYSNVTFSVDLGRASANSGSGCKAYYTLNGGTTWVEFGSVVNTTGSADGAFTTFSVAGLTGTSAQIKVAHWGTSSTPKYRHDNVKMVGTISPTTPPSNLVISNNTGTSVDLSWTNGSGGRVIVVAKPSSATLTDPTSGVTYVANTVFGSGTQIGTGNYVVYDGTGTSATITGLTNGVDYDFSVYTYNSGVPCYNPNEAFASTLCTPPTVIPSAGVTSAITAGSINVAWTNGNGDRTMVVVRANGTSQSEPLPTVSYTANAAFGAGSQIGTGNYVAYVGVGTNVTVTGLAPGTNYIFSIYTFNSADNCYNLTELFVNATTTSTTTYEIDVNNGSTITTCSGTFTDSGGGAGVYGNNENKTITFCSGNGKLLHFDFGGVEVMPGDVMNIYDGNSIASPLIVSLNGNASYLFDYFANTDPFAFLSPSSCITFQFISNGSGTANGWSASISCIDPINCSANPDASDLFGAAPFVCNLNGYCGITSGDFDEDLPANLTTGSALFNGSLENNSWIKFVASATSAVFDFSVPLDAQCFDGVQIAIYGYNGTTFTLMSPVALTSGGRFGTFTVTGSGLTVGSTYYIMIDGYAGDICNYTISANAGIYLVDAGPDQSICLTNTTLAGSSVGTGIWTVVSGTGTFTNPTSPTSAVSGLSLGANVFKWTSSSACDSISDTVTITVNSCSCPTATIDYADPFCVSVTAAQSVTLNGTGTYTGGTYTASPAGLTINATTGAITPSTSTPNTYTVTYTILPAGGCATTTTVTTTVVINPTSTSISNTTICQTALPYTWNGLSFATAGSQSATLVGYNGCDSLATLILTVNSNVTPTFSFVSTYCVGAVPALLPTTSDNGITGTWSPATISTAGTGSVNYTFTPDAGQCATTATVSVTVTQPAIPATLCYETATWNAGTCTWDISGTQPAAPATLCYETATWNAGTCVWDITGTQPAVPATLCYETATWNAGTCVWDVTGTQPASPATLCYETATWNAGTCTWDISGTQPAAPATLCYETATWNAGTCVWDISGTQPAAPATLCYETATWNAGTCVWDITGTQPAAPATLCYETATWNTGTCAWDITGTQPAAPATLCYETATWNAGTCVWDISGTQPAAPATLCYETATWNAGTCVWDVTGTQPASPATLCYETATWNAGTCVWDISGTQPAAPATLCYETATWNAGTCTWDISGTQPAAPAILCYETATWNAGTCVWDISGTQPAAPATLCYETATWNAGTCVWDITGTQPAAPATLCYETATWNAGTCTWDITGTQPLAPATLCYETATWNAVTCVWDISGTQPLAPATACYETATWNAGTCVWDITGTQPVAPATLCYETATWNAGTCTWDITGTQPLAPATLCYETATWNAVTCVWDITGTQPLAPVTSCYETATWNSGTCTWDVSGTQPLAPATACYETATWNIGACTWDVTGTQPAAPATLCYETATWNAGTCVWDITGTQPAAPSTLCYETATWNAGTCTWDITGTQPAAPATLCYETATWNAGTCTWDVTGTQPAAPAILCYETATWNSGTCSWDVTGTQPPVPAILCYETATWNATTCVWDITGNQPLAPVTACYETATWNAGTCTWDISGTQPAAPATLCYETATWNAGTCTWDITGTQPPTPASLCYETATWNTGTCAWDVSGTQPAAPATLCYENATWNAGTCVWDISGTQPLAPVTACYETATWNAGTCAWDVTGTQPATPATLCYETATWNAGTCTWDISGTQPAAPVTLCYETATWNAGTCVWDITGTQPPAPATLCYETATWNAGTCAWDITGIQPTAPATVCYETATWNAGTCVWDVTGTQPAAPATLCYETATWNAGTCTWDISGTQPAAPVTLCYETATWNAGTCVWDITGTQPIAPATLCYETATWNAGTCAWDVIGTQPPAPATLCYETATWNAGTCVWDVSGTQPAAPATLCYETATWNAGTCVWDVSGTQPAAPATLCYETATWNSGTCAWDITGTQPLAPTTACYETATWNAGTCNWDISGTQPVAPATLCYETATWNAGNCTWDVSGTQPLAPATLCYETATWNSGTCAWDITGIQPAAPATLCYETATWNAGTCAWDISGTQPAAPATLCYETATWNAGACTWDVTGTQPLAPATACYETATWNAGTCTWDVTGTQPTAPATLCYETATWNAGTCTWDITGTQPLAPAILCYETATWNAGTCVWDISGTQPPAPATLCYETATWNAGTCAWDISGTQPLAPATACYETATWNAGTCVWDITGTQPFAPATACYETATWNAGTCVWDITGTQPLAPATACYETASWNAGTCVWDITGTPITAATNPNNPTICAGDPIPALTVNTPGAGLQVNWYGSALGGVALATNTNSFTPTSTQAGINTYYAEVTQVSPICVSPRTAVILTINPTSASTTNITVCAPELPYTWNGVPYNAAGSYTYTMNNYLGCDSVATLNLTVTPGTNPTFTILDSICTGATPPILPTTSNNGITGTWSPSVVSNTTTGSYTFTPTAGQCANNVIITVLVRVNAVPTLAQMNVSSNSPICAGSALNMYANGGVDYEWSGPAPYAVTFQNPVRPNATVAMSGSYFVTVTTAAGCSSTTSLNVVVNPLPTATASSNSPLCAGSILSLTSGGGTGYNWSGPSSYGNLTQNPSISPLTTANAGNYTVTVTSAAGCTSTAQTTVVINSLPTATASNNGPLCAGATLNLTSGGGTGYSWSGPNPYTSIVQNPIILSATNLNSGIYTVTVTSGNGCTSTTQTTVMINNNPTPSISGDTVICRGESTTLTASGGSIYVWGVQVSPSITVSPNTTTIYQVIASNTQGCTQTASVTVNVSDIVMNAISAISDTCSQSYGSISLNVGNGFGSYNYQWSHPAGTNNNIQNNLLGGDYIVTVTDAVGCQLIDTITVGNFPLPILSIANSTDDHCSLGIGTATVVATGGTGNYNYQWNTVPAQNSASATNLTSGSYTVQVNDEHCSNSVVVNVGNIAGPTASAGYTSNTNGNVQFNDQSTGASQWLWQFDDINSSTNQHPTYRYDNGGLFEVILTVTDDFGCIDTALIQVVVDEGMDVWIPDAFTPNGDGTNDDFGPVARGYRKENYQMVIYDRWGKQLFITDDYFKHWNGAIEGEPIMTNAVYVYIIHIRDLAGKMHKYQGRVTLIVGL